MRLILVAILCSLMTACFTNGKRGGGQSPAIYDFGLFPARTAEKLPRAEPMALEVRAPLWFDSMGIEYRLAYADKARLREYTQARWVGPPAQLIQQRLVQQLGFVPHGQSRARCVLRVDLTEFSQVFDTPDISRAVLQGRLQWLDKSRARIAEREINLTSESSSADASGGVAALSDTVEQLTTTVMDWEAQLIASGQLGRCRA